MPTQVVGDFFGVAFSGEIRRHHQVLVDRTTVRVWDSVGRHYTTCHCLTEEQMADLRAAALARCPNLELKQTLDEAVYAAEHSLDDDLSLAADLLRGCPEGGWNETQESRDEIRGLLPHRQDRSYSLVEFIERCYVVIDGRYQPRWSRFAARSAGGRA